MFVSEGTNLETKNSLSQNDIIQTVETVGI